MKAGCYIPTPTLSEDSWTDLGSVASSSLLQITVDAEDSTAAACRPSHQLTNFPPLPKDPVRLDIRQSRTAQFSKTLRMKMVPMLCSHTQFHLAWAMVIKAYAQTGNVVVFGTKTSPGNSPSNSQDSLESMSIEVDLERSIAAHADMICTDLGMRMCRTSCTNNSAPSRPAVPRWC